MLRPTVHQQLKRASWRAQLGMVRRAQRELALRISRSLHLSTRQSRRVARDMVANGHRNRIVRRAFDAGRHDELRSLITWSDEGGYADQRAAHGSVVLCAAHWGPWIGAVEASSFLDDALVIANLGPALSQHAAFEIERPGMDGSNGPAALKTAIDRLRANGVVAIPTWGAGVGASVSVPFLDGRIELPSGLVAMARLGRAPIHLMTARWVDGFTRIEFVVHAPVDLASSDRESDGAVLHAVAHRLEQLIIAAPESVDGRALPNLPDVRPA